MRIEENHHEANKHNLGGCKSGEVIFYEHRYYIVVQWKEAFANKMQIVDIYTGDSFMISQNATVHIVYGKFVVESIG